MCGEGEQSAVSIKLRSTIRLYAVLLTRPLMDRLEVVHNRTSRLAGFDVFLIDE